MFNLLILFFHYILSWYVIRDDEIPRIKALRYRLHHEIIQKKINEVIVFGFVTRNMPEFEEDEHWAVNPDHHKRWDWIISEMIWAFEQIVDDTSNEQFYDHSVYVFDREGHAKHEDRIQRGTMLFGKYYQGLWD